MSRRRYTASLNVDDGSLRRTIKRLERAIGQEIDSATEDALDEAVDRGKEHIVREDAMWRYEVLGKTMHADFDWTELSPSERYVIYNSSMHAGIVDEGAEFTKHPQAQGLVPWVIENLGDWDPSPDTSGGTGPSSGGGGGTGNSALDSLAQGLGTITNEQETRNGGLTAGGGSELTDRWDDDGNQLLTKTNGENGKPTHTSFLIDQSMDYNETKDVTNHVTKGTYKTLSTEQTKRLQERLKEHYPEEGVDAMYKAVENWKSTSFDWNGEWVERIVRDRYDIDAAIRDSGHRIKDEKSLPPTDLLKYGPLDPELEDIYHELSVASKQMLQQHVADDRGKMKLYRGLRREQTAGLARQMFDNPDEDSFIMDDSVVQNYSTAAGVKDFFGAGAEVEIIADTDDDVLIAPDFIMDGVTDWPAGHRDAEVHIIGGRRLIPKEGITFSNIDSNRLINVDFSLWTDDDHEAMKQLVDVMHSKDQRIATEDGKDRLMGWLSAYDGDDREEYGEKVSALVEQVGNPTTEFDDKRYDTQVYYGQEVTYTIIGDQTADATVERIENDTIYLDDGTTLPDDEMGWGQFTDAENWYDLSPEARRDQLRDELRAKTVFQEKDDNGDPILDDTEVGWLMDEHVDHILDNEYERLGEEAVRRLVHNLQSFNVMDANYLAAVSSGSWDGRYKLLWSEHTFNDQFVETMYHENNHALLGVHGVDNGNPDIANMWASDEYLSSPRPLQTFFDAQGNYNDLLANELAHLDAENYLLNYHDNLRIVDDPDRGTYAESIDGSGPIGFHDWRQDVWDFTENWAPYEGVSGPPTEIEETDLDPISGVIEPGDFISLTQQMSTQDGLEERDSLYIFRDYEWEDMGFSRGWKLRVQKLENGQYTTLTYDVDKNELTTPVTEVKHTRPDVSPPAATDWEPDPTRDKWGRLAESLNHAWWTGILLMQKDNSPGGLASLDLAPTDPYSLTSTQELFAGLGELMHTDDELQAQDVRRMYAYYPYLIDAYLEIASPSVEIEEVLMDIADDDTKALL